MFVSRIVDLSPRPGQHGKLAVKLRLGYFCLAMSAEHADFLKRKVSPDVLGMMLDSQSPIHNPTVCKLMKKEPNPKPTNAEKHKNFDANDEDDKVEIESQKLLSVPPTVIKTEPVLSQSQTRYYCPFLQRETNCTLKHQCNKVLRQGFVCWANHRAYEYK